MLLSMPAWFFFRVIQINAKSFQEIDIEYSLAAETTADSATDLPFVVDRNLGWLTLTRQLKYISDPHQYRMVVTAREPASGIESKVLVSVATGLLVWLQYTRNEQQRI